MSAISDEDAKDILGELQSRATSCRSLAQVAEPFPTENARLTSAANAWEHAAELVRQWAERREREQATVAIGARMDKGNPAPICKMCLQPMEHDGGPDYSCDRCSTKHTITIAPAESDRAP